MAAALSERGYNSPTPRLLLPFDGRLARRGFPRFPWPLTREATRLRLCKQV
jgi:hypothetical protein